MSAVITMRTMYPQVNSNFIYEIFNLNNFLNNYNTLINPLPEYNNHTVPENEYPEDWNNISKAYRKSKKWICEKCNKDCTTNKYLLHAHHIGPKYDNNWSSLRALCYNCHKQEPFHSHMM